MHTSSTHTGTSSSTGVQSQDGQGHNTVNSLTDTSTRVCSYTATLMLTGVGSEDQLSLALLQEEGMRGQEERKGEGRKEEERGGEERRVEESGGEGGEGRRGEERGGKGRREEERAG